MTISSYIAKCYVPEVLAKKSQYSRESQKTLSLSPLLREVTIAEFGQVALQAYKNEISHHSPATQGSYLSRLRTVLRYAHRMGDRGVPPEIVIKRGKGNKRGLTAAEQKALLATAKDDWQAHLIVLLGLDLGLRIGERMALTWDDVSMDPGHGMPGAHVAISKQLTQGGQITPLKSRGENACYYLPLSKRLIDLLASVPRNPYNWLVPSKEAVSEPMKRSDGIRLVHRTAKAAGLPKEVRGTHCHRHTFVTRLTSSGVSDVVGMQLSRHESHALYRSYAHPTGQDLANALAQIET